MAQRRMISTQIFDSARFLRMPVTSQALYAHLVARADDDGVVEAYSVIRTVGATDDDLNVLVDRGFVVVLNEDLVSYIKDWRVQNEIRADRLKPSPYRELLVKILPDVQLQEPKRRADLKSACPMDVQWTADGPPNIRQVKLIENNHTVRADKPPKKEKPIRNIVPPKLEWVRAYCAESENDLVDPQSFMDFYDTNGWVQGGGKGKPIKDWQAAVRTWQRKAKEKQGMSRQNPAPAQKSLYKRRLA